MSSHGQDCIGDSPFRLSVQVIYWQLRLDERRTGSKLDTIPRTFCFSRRSIRKGGDACCETSGRSTALYGRSSAGRRGSGVTTSSWRDIQSVQLNRQLRHTRTFRMLIRCLCFSPIPLVTSTLGQSLLQQAYLHSRVACNNPLRCHCYDCDACKQGSLSVWRFCDMSNNVSSLDVFSRPPTDIRELGRGIYL